MHACPLPSSQHIIIAAAAAVCPPLAAPPTAPCCLQTSDGPALLRVYTVDWPLNQISLSPGQQYYLTVQGSNDAGAHGVRRAGRLAARQAGSGRGRGHMLH
jgi:hypothetical protein